MTASQNTFCKFKLRDKASAQSTKVKQQGCNTNKVNSKTQLATKPPYSKATRVEVSKHKQPSYVQGKHNITTNTKRHNSSTLGSYLFFFTLGNCTVCHIVSEIFSPQEANRKVRRHHMYHVKSHEVSRTTIPTYNAHLLTLQKPSTVFFLAATINAWKPRQTPVRSVALIYRIRHHK